ncbi:MAG: hypothetical protein QOE86_3924 [Solirubrobacteraceae bacterium]|nr:hypothetical protein [Solirubrobacteraceae bacterium]
MARIALICCLLVGALAAPASALTRGQVFGIGNVGDPSALFDPRLLALQPTATRFIANWDVARTAGAERNRVDAWYEQAQVAGLRPLLSFQGFKQRHVPSVAAYARAVRAAVARWPKIREWQAWNEANHVTQPATYRHPARAARYAKALERACPRCTVLPITVQISNSSSTRRWVAAFLRAYGHTPRIWAVHGYSDANRYTFTRLAGFLREHPHGRVWITETGALAKFATAFPYDLARQRRATSYVFRAATRFRSRVDRLYWWQWRGDPRPRRTRWDSGLVDASGKPRPAYRSALAWRFRR